MEGNVHLTELVLIDNQNGAPWLPPPPPLVPSNYLANDLANNQGSFTDATGACLPSMASFRPQPSGAYANNGNEQAAQTGEALGKALQSVRLICHSNKSIVEFLCTHRSIPAIIPILRRHRRLSPHHHQRR